MKFKLKKMDNSYPTITRTFELLDLYKKQYAEKENALNGKEDGKWYSYSAREYVSNTKLTSYGFMSMGIKKGDKVATVTNNRPEWNFIDLGLAQIGAVHVPIYPTISFEDYRFILNHCEAKFVVVADKNLYDKIRPLVDEIETLHEIFTFDRLDDVRHWTDLIKQGDEYNRKSELTAIRDSISEDDLATIIYTSGTTGVPKGVMLSHKNLVSNFTTHAFNHNLDSNAKAMSFLPLCHVLERSINYHYQYKGISIYYVASLAAIIPSVKEVKPQMFCTVPRLLERIYDGIISKGRTLTGIKKKIFFWAVKLGDRFDYGLKFSWWYKQQRKVADKLVYSKWREVMGGEIELIVSGGAALQPRISKVLGVANIKTLEGYGLTETSPVIAVSNLATNEIKIGTVGPVLSGVDMKFANDGEIICKGPNVMLGYYKEPELTRNVMDEEGYFHTGDIGVMVENKYLKITDRKKEIFKLSGGKYIAPQMIENKLKESFFIEQAMVVGENEKFASALIVPAFDYLKKWTDENNIKVVGKTEIIAHPQVVAAIQKEVLQVNKTLGQVEEIKRYKLVADEWTPDSGELSPTLKLKRNVIAERYSTLIEEIFATSRDADDQGSKRNKRFINLSFAELINQLRNGNGFGNLFKDGK